LNKPDLDIVKSPEAERMRQMVTAGFYDRSRLALWIFEVMGREYDDMAKWSRELRYEAFPKTATWSIAIWEWIYGLAPDDALPLEFRRQQIVSKRLQRPPINQARMEAVLSVLTGDTVSVTENTAPYRFSVEVEARGQSIEDYKTALTVLRKIKPSHLSFSAGFVFPPRCFTTNVAIAVVAAMSIMETTLPQWLPLQAYEEDMRIVAVSASVQQTTLKEIE
jgi:uncharacterized protein YmfQ (DUF2313 family)